MKPMPGAPVLRASGLRKDYGGGAGLVRAVDGVDLEVAAGQTVAVMGPSGCGKSTLLHLLGGLDRLTGGEIELAGRRLDKLSERELARLRREAVGFVFQAFHLMDELTAVENVELPALLAGRSPRAARRRAAELARALGATPRQVGAALSAAQALPALPGAILGVPLGLALYAAADGGGLMTIPPAWWLAAAVLGTLIAVTGLTGIPARIGARRPAAEVLQAELT